MRIEYSTLYKCNNDNKIYIPLVHNNDVNKVICVRVFLDIADDRDYINIFDNYYVNIRKIHTIEITDLTGPILNTKGDELSIPHKTRNSVYYAIWKHKISILENSYKKYYRGEAIKFIEWTNFKYILDSSRNVSMSILNADNEIIVKNKCVYWVELGHNIGSELRKERPAIIWKKFKNENRYFIIPITSSNKNDSSFVEIESMKKYATLEHMKLVSVKRIRRPYMDHDDNIKKLNYDEIQVLKEKMKVFLNLD